MRPKTSTSVSPRRARTAARSRRWSLSAALRTSKSTGVGLHVRSAGDGHTGLAERQVLAAGRASVLREWQLERVVHAGKAPRRWWPGLRPYSFIPRRDGGREKPTRGRRRRAARPVGPISGIIGLWTDRRFFPTTPRRSRRFRASRCSTPTSTARCWPAAARLWPTAPAAPSSATVEAIVALNRAELTVVPVSGRNSIAAHRGRPAAGLDRLHRRGRFRPRARLWPRPARRVQHRRVACAPALTGRDPVRTHPRCWCAASAAGSVPGAARIPHSLASRSGSVSPAARLP